MTTKFVGVFNTNIVEDTVAAEIQQSESVNWKAGNVYTLRDDNGNVIVYEDKESSPDNIKTLVRPDQYIAFDFQERAFDAVEVSKVIDTKISELYSEVSLEEQIRRFFSLFEKLALQIPKLGTINSLRYLMQRIAEITDNSIIDPVLFASLSGSYANLQEEFDRIKDLLEAASEASASLELENQNLQQQLDILSQIIINNLTGGKISIEELIRLLNELSGRIISEPIYDAYENAQYNCQVVATANIVVGTWNLELVNTETNITHSWLQLIPTSLNTARITGIPPGGSVGMYEVTIRAEGPRGLIYQRYNLTVHEEGSQGGGSTLSGFTVLLKGALNDETFNELGIGSEWPVPVDYKIYSKENVLLNEISDRRTPMSIKELPYWPRIEFVAHDFEIIEKNGNDEYGNPVWVTIMYMPVAWILRDENNVDTILAQNMRTGSYELTLVDIENNYTLFVVCSEKERRASTTPTTNNPPI